MGRSEQLAAIAAEGIRGGGALTAELLALPATLRQLRILDEALPELSRVVVDELQERVEHLDRVDSELSATLTSVLGSIPGVRRSVRSS